MGRQCQTFYPRLIELLAEKRDIHKSVMMYWIRSKLCYALLNPAYHVYEVPVRETVTSQSRAGCCSSVWAMFNKINKETCQQNRDIDIQNIMINIVTINFKLMTAAAYSLQRINSM